MGSGVGSGVAGSLLPLTARPHLAMPRLDFGRLRPEAPPLSQSGALGQQAAGGPPEVEVGGVDGFGFNEADAPPLTQRDADLLVRRRAASADACRPSLSACQR